MTANLLKSEWADLDAAELRLILLELIGRPGQYDGRESNPDTFYLPQADSSCQIKLTFFDKGKTKPTFSDKKRLVAIEPGPAFDAAKWREVVEEIEGTGQCKVGRDWSFGSFRVTGSWLGKRSGVQILPPPADAPSAPVEIAEHPFILEFPVIASERWPITNFRRRRQHRQLTFLLNILIEGHTTIQPRRTRHFWGITHEKDTLGHESKWVHEFYSANIGERMRDELSPPASEKLEEIDPEKYYAMFIQYGQGLQVPADLDDSICCYMRLSKADRDKFSIAGFWLDTASRQRSLSYSASFASLVIAIESLGNRSLSSSAARFHDFIERHATAASPERRRDMYALRNDILHGSGLMEMDQDADFGWAPPEMNERDLMDELWGVARLAIRNWLKNPSPTGPPPTG